MGQDDNQRRPLDPQRQLCPHCGVAVTAQLAGCLFCGQAIPRRIPAPAPSKGLVWAALRCHFTCRACGLPSPMDQLDVDGVAGCLHCGLEQAFDAQNWREALEHAHAIADLAGPGPEGVFPHPRVSISGENPLGDVALERPLTSTDAIGSSGLQAEVMPGHPLCARCARPLQASAQQGSLTTHCPQCQAQAAYQLPPRAAVLHPALRGVLAPSHRSDRAAAQVEQSAGAVALSCPNCSGALSVSGDSRLVTCPYCGTEALVPSRLLRHYLQKAPQAKTWWLLFAGPSATRLALEASGTPAVETAPAQRAPTILRLLLAVGLPAAILLFTGFAVLFLWSAM